MSVDYLQENKRKMSSSSTKKFLVAKDLISSESISFLNYRIQEEERSWRIYEDMYLYLENVGYLGAAKLFREYAEEELEHANWAKKYLLGLGIKPELKELPSITTEYNGLPEILRIALDHEVKITQQCTKLAIQSGPESKDFMLHELALQYLKEQHEECSRQQNWVDQLELFGEEKDALRLLDNKMSKSCK